MHEFMHDAMPLLLRRSIVPVGAQPQHGILAPVYWLYLCQPFRVIRVIVSEFHCPILQAKQRGYLVDVGLPVYSHASSTASRIICFRFSCLSWPHSSCPSS